MGRLTSNFGACYSSSAGAYMYLDYTISSGPGYATCTITNMIVDSTSTQNIVHNHGNAYVNFNGERSKSNIHYAPGRGGSATVWTLNVSKTNYNSSGGATSFYVYGKYWFQYNSKWVNLIIDTYISATIPPAKASVTFGSGNLSLTKSSGTPYISAQIKNGTGSNNIDYGWSNTSWMEWSHGAGNGTYYIYFDKKTTLVQMGNNTSIGIECKCNTMSGGSVTGTDKIKYTVTLTDRSYAPTIDYENERIASIDAKTYAKFAINDDNKVNVPIIGTTKLNVSFSSSDYSIADGTSFNKLNIYGSGINATTTSTSYTYSYYPNRIEKKYASLTVYDKRGFSNSYSNKVLFDSSKWFNYTSPTVYFEALRCNVDGVIDTDETQNIFCKIQHISGNYFAYYDSNHVECNGISDLKLNYRIKGESSWKSVNLPINKFITSMSDGKFSQSNSVKIDMQFDIDKTYELMLAVKDYRVDDYALKGKNTGFFNNYLTYVQYPFDILTKHEDSKRPVMVDESNNVIASLESYSNKIEFGAAFGKRASTVNMLEVAWPLKLENGFPIDVYRYEGRVSVSSSTTYFDSKTFELPSGIYVLSMGHLVGPPNNSGFANFWLKAASDNTGNYLSRGLTSTCCGTTSAGAYIWKTGIIVLTHPTSLVIGSYRYVGASEYGFAVEACRISDVNSSFGDSHIRIHNI